MQKVKDIQLGQHAIGGMLGMRASAQPFRQRIERALASGCEISIDFTGVEVTQGFVDELLGALILRNGPGIMNALVLRGCSESTKAIICFVVSDRAQQHELAQAI